MNNLLNFFYMYWKFNSANMFILNKILKEFSNSHENIIKFKFEFYTVLRTQKSNTLYPAFQNKNLESKFSSI